MKEKTGRVGYPDGGRKSMPGIHPITIPDVRKFLPADHAQVERTREGFLSLFIVQPTQQISYQNHIMGRVFNLNDRGEDRYCIAPHGTLLQNIQEIVLGRKILDIGEGTIFADIAARLLVTSIGLKELKEKNAAVGCLVEHDRKIGMYSQPIPPLTPQEIEGLHTQHRTRRKNLHPDNDLFNADKETRFDRLILDPEAMAREKGHDLSNFLDYYLTIVTPAYEKRIKNLTEGFVSLETPFTLAEVPQGKSAEATYIDRRFYVPSLVSLYFIYQLEQAGFEVRLAERKKPLSLQPDNKTFVIMIRPNFTNKTAR